MFRAAAAFTALNVTILDKVKPDISNETYIDTCTVKYVDPLVILALQLFSPLGGLGMSIVNRAPPIP